MIAVQRAEFVESASILTANAQFDVKRGQIFEAEAKTLEVKILSFEAKANVMRPRTKLWPGGLQISGNADTDSELNARSSFSKL